MKDYKLKQRNLRVSHTLGWNPGEDAKEQVGMTIIKGDSAAMGRNHGCDAYAAPCDDPEIQLDLSNGAKDRKNFSRGGIAA
jgi:hypothetical protein